MSEGERSERKSHWDSAYATKGDDVSWYQSNPARSLEMINAAAPMLSASIIDVGAGASRLVDKLLDIGYSDITLLDVSEVALGATRHRLEGAGGKVSWIAADITLWRPDRSYEIWHDRAVFHFLTDEASQEAYIFALKQGTRLGSTIILFTFAPTGPEKCSGLPVQRYSADTLAARLGPDFALYTDGTERHPTPFGTTQDFTYAGFRRCR